MKKSVGPIIIGLVIVGFLAVGFNNNYLTAGTAITVEENPAPVKTEEIDHGQLWFISGSESSTEILTISPKGQEKIIFSDKDEKNKLNGYGTIGKTDKFIPIITVDGKLIKIALDGSGKLTELNSVMGNLTDFALSPDGKKFVYTTFSNAERDYGYRLILSDEKVQTPKEAVRHELPIKNVVWKNNNLILFAQTKANGQTILTELNTDSLKQTEIYKTDQEIYSFSLNGDKILLSQGNTDSGASFLATITSDGKNFSKIYTESKGIIYYPQLSADKTKYAYLLSGQVTSRPFGSIFSIDLKGKNKQKIAQGFKLLDWKD